MRLLMESPQTESRNQSCFKEQALKRVLKCKQRKKVFSGPSFADAADRAPPQHPLNAYVIAFHIKVSVWASSHLVHLEEVSILSWVAQVIICVYFLPFSYET